MTGNEDAERADETFLEGVLLNALVDADAGELRAILGADYAEADEANAVCERVLAKLASGRPELAAILAPNIEVFPLSPVPPTPAETPIGRQPELARRSPSTGAAPAAFRGRLKWLMQERADHIGWKRPAAFAFGAMTAALLIFGAASVLHWLPDGMSLNPQSRPLAQVVVRSTPNHSRLASSQMPSTQIVARSFAPEENAAAMLASSRCLAEAMYYEARGEGPEGQEAVAEVVLNRLRSGQFAGSICGVVYQSSGGSQCQFAFACNGDLRKPKDRRAWREASELATQIVTGERSLPNATDGAVVFHSSAVEPDWAPKMEEVTRIGNHVFYRTVKIGRHVYYRGA